MGGLAMAKVTALLCPECGSRLEAESGSRLALCNSCESSVVIAAQSGFSRYYAEPGISRNGAVVRAGQNAGMSFELIAAQLMFVPVWWVAAEVFGFVAGQRPIVEKTIIVPANDYRAGSENDRKVHQKTGGEVVKKSIWFKNDCRIMGIKWKELGGSKIKDSIPLMELILEEDSELTKLGLVLDPEAFEEQEIMEKVSSYFKGQILYPYGSYSSLTGHVSLLKQNKRLIYYPVWRVLGFTKRGRYKCLLDGVSGETVYTKQYILERVYLPSKDLLIVLLVSMVLGFIFSPNDSYNGWLAYLGLFVLAGFWAGGVMLNKLIMQRLAEKAARFIWKV
jgi:hypothetical protein